MSTVEITRPHSPFSLPSTTADTKLGNGSDAHFTPRSTPFSGPNSPNSLRPRARVMTGGESEQMASIALSSSSTPQSHSTSQFGYGSGPSSHSTMQYGAPGNGLVEPFRGSSGGASSFAPRDSYTHASANPPSSLFGASTASGQDVFASSSGGLGDLPGGASSSTLNSSSDRGSGIGAGSYQSSSSQQQPYPHHRHQSTGYVPLMQQQGPSPGAGLTSSASNPSLSQYGESSGGGGSGDWGLSSGGWTPSRRSFGLPGQSPMRFSKELLAGGPASGVRVPPSPGTGREHLQIQHYFPDNGESGSLVTVVVSVQQDWARQAGLGFAAPPPPGTTPTRFFILFGNAEVEARHSRTSSPIPSFAPLDGGPSSPSGPMIHLAVTATAPTYASTQWSGPRVTLRLKVVGPSIPPSLEQMASSGFVIGDFNYWHVSPRESLKRPADFDNASDLPLRRPASFPALASPGGSSSGPALGPSRLPSFSAQSTASPGGRPNLGDSLGLSRATGGSASGPFLRHQHRSSGSYSTGEAPSSGSGDLTGTFTFTPPHPPAGTSDPYGVSDPLRRSSTSVLGLNAGAGPSRPMMTSEGSRSPPQGFPIGEPTLMRTSQILIPQGNSSSNRSGSPGSANGSNRAKLVIHGDIDEMALGWSHEEWRSGRRLVQFWRRQEGTTIHAMCRPIHPSQYVPNSIVISCIFREDKNSCFVTSVDAIYLLEALVASRFTVDEKNRIRRNLEGFRPLTISKSKKESERFFKLIMSFPNPKPRNIEKDVKVFPWQILSQALSKIIGKYSAAGDFDSAGAGAMAGPGGIPMNPPLVQHMRHESSDSSVTPEGFREARLTGGAGGDMHHAPPYGMPQDANQQQGAPLPTPSRFAFSPSSAFSDFMVSPSAFGQAQLPSSGQQPGHPSHHQSGYGGLGFEPNDGFNRQQ